MITNKKAADLNKLLNSEDFKEFKFTLAGNRKIQSNIKDLKDFMELLVDTEKRHTTPSAEFVAMEADKKEMVKPFCQLDDKEEIKLTKENGLILKDPKDEPMVVQLLTDFSKKNEKLIKEYNESLQEWAAHLNEEAELSLKMVDEKEMKMPDDLFMDASTFDILSLIVPSFIEDDKKE